MAKGDADPNGTSASAMAGLGKAAIDALRRYPVLIVAIVVLIVVAIVALVAVPTLGLPAFIIFVVLAIVVLLIAMTKRGRATDEQFSQVKEATVVDTTSYALQLDDEHRQVIRKALRSAASEAAAILGVDSGKVRSNIFGMRGDNRLHLITELTHNMQNVTELTVSMPPGTGSTGRCYATAKPNIAVRRSKEGTEPDWGVDGLGESEMQKLVPALCWILSVPVITGGQGAIPVWILNVDGLVPVDESSLQTVILSLLEYSEAVSLLLRTTLGEKL